MKRMKWLIMGLTSALVVGWGCGDGSPSTASSNEEATVHGTVTVRGKAPTKGEISFDPGNINRKGEMPRTAPIGKDGSYQLKTLVGENSVTVRTPEIDKDAALSSNQRMVDVKPGDNIVPIEIQ